MSQRVEIVPTGEKAVLVGIITQLQNEKKSKEYLDELSFLAETAGATTIKRFTQKVSKTNPKTFIGSGKIKEIALFVEENDIVHQSVGKKIGRNIVFYAKQSLRRIKKY